MDSQVRTIYCVGRYTALGSVIVARVGSNLPLAQTISQALNAADVRRWYTPAHFVFAERSDDPDDLGNTHD